MRRGGLRRIFVDAFTENLGLKAISLVAAVFLFAAIRGGEEAQRAPYVDVVTLAPPPGADRVLVAEVPDRVKIVLHGPRSIVNEVRADSIPPVQADLRDTRKRSFDFDDSLFRLPAGVQIRSISPASFPLVWEERREQRLQIEPKIRGEPVAGQQLKPGASASPSEVSLIGAASEVEVADTALTETIDVEGFGPGRYTQEVRLRRPPPHTWYDRDDPVTVTFEIGPDLQEKTLRRLQIRVAETTWRVEVSPRTVDVVLRGPRSVVSAIDPDRVIPFLDGPGLEERGAGSYRETPRLEDLPPGVRVVSFQPSKVFVVVRRPR